MRKFLLVLLANFFALGCQNTNDFNTTAPTIIEEEESNTLFITPADEFGETSIEEQHDDPNTLFFRQNVEGFRMEEVPYPVGGIERERVVNPTESLSAFTLCDEFCDIFVEDISANRVYELKAPSFIPRRHFSNLVWIQEKVLAFDQSTQPHLSIHYVVDVEEKELINVYPFPETVTVKPDPHVTPTRQQLLAVTVTPDALPTVTAIPTAPVHQQCTESEPELVEESSLLSGLILSGRWEAGPGLAVLGSHGVSKPVTTYYYTSHLFEVISPDGKWIAARSLMDTIDRDSNTYAIEMQVTDLDTARKFQKSYGEVSLSSFDWLRWANNSQLVLPLKNQDELFQWLVWTPLTGEQELLSVELTGIENAMSFYQIPPVYDPHLDLVVYPCELCDNVAYIVKNLRTGETEWTIDFDPQPSYAYRGLPVWSPNGAYLAVGGGNNLLNRLKIVNRDGTTLYDIALPDGGAATAVRLVWSPNSDYLAFSRANPNPDAPYGYTSTLAYVRLSDGAVIDLCVDLPITAINWSPDNTKIAFSQQNLEVEAPHFISIVDIHTGDIFHVLNPDVRRIVGWINPVEHEE